MDINRYITYIFIFFFFNYLYDTRVQKSSKYINRHEFILQIYKSVTQFICLLFKLDY